MQGAPRHQPQQAQQQQQPSHRLEQQQQQHHERRSNASDSSSNYDINREKEEVLKMFTEAFGRFVAKGGGNRQRVADVQGAPDHFQQIFIQL